MKPLNGIRVIEMATVVAAPTAGRVMCDYGAEVIKFETLSGDELRTAGNQFSLPTEDDNNPMFTIINSGKQTMSIDLKSKEGKEIVYKLLEDADVLISNIRYASLGRMGFDYESLKDRFPQLIFAHFSGYGIEGPEKNAPGFDITAFWMRNGAINDWRSENSFPMGPSYAFGDVATSNALLSGILMALVGRDRTGLGTLVKVSLMGTGIWCNYTDILTAQEPYNRVHRHNPLNQANPFAAMYECADKRYIGFFTNDYSRELEKFAKLLGIEDILHDSRYATIQSLHATDTFKVLFARVADILAQKTTDEWQEIFKDNNVSCQIVKTASDVTKDAQAIANRYVEEITFSDGKTVMMPTPPIQFSAYKRLRTTPSTAIGTHTDTILDRLGYSTEDISAMKAANIIK